jgi:Arc/MetJ-type ribon-helix-helix transcriptional regulator
MPKKQADKEEQEFQKGIRGTAWFKEYVKEYREEPDLNTKDYDYRSAWKSGIRPERDPFDKNKYHWASSNPETGEMLKSKEHPTAWKEEYMKRTGKNPDEAGITKEQAGMAKGGQVKAKQQTKKLLERGGMLQEGGTVDPVSGNDVPVGSMQEEVRDDIPAQLSEGEFVFPADVVRFIGLERLMQMRQAAKQGLKKMEDMGQMSNPEEATEEDDGEFESELDDIMAEMEGEERKMAVGGDVMPMEQVPAEQPAASAMQQTPEAIPTKSPATEEPPTLTSEQMATIQETAKNMQNRKLDIDQTLMHAPTEGLTPSKIVTDSLAAEGYKGNTDVFLRSLTIRAAKKQAAIVRFSDTVFVGMPVDQSTMEVHLFTKDDPKKLQDSIKAGIQTLQNVGTTRIQTTTTNANLLSMLKKLQYPLSVQEDNGMFKLTMEIGK